MTTIISASCEADALARALEAISIKGQRRGDKSELLSCVVTIPFKPEEWRHYRSLEPAYRKLCSSIGLRGWERATRVYTDTRDRPTKPSYIGRLIAYPDRHRRSAPSEDRINQIATIAQKLALKPGYSFLSFVFLRPADLHDQFRPGYVPCPIAGDFKFRDGKLHLTVMFRTCDVLGVGYADIWYLRQLQLDVLAEAKRLTEKTVLQNGEPGDLTLFFARAYISRRVGTTKARSIAVTKSVIQLLDGTAHTNVVS